MAIDAKRAPAAVQEEMEPVPTEVVGLPPTVKKFFSLWFHRRIAGKSWRRISWYFSLKVDGKYWRNVDRERRNDFRDVSD
jgi:hypothetical protein